MLAAVSDIVVSLLMIHAIEGFLKGYALHDEECPRFKELFSHPWVLFFIALLISAPVMDAICILMSQASLHWQVIALSWVLTRRFGHEDVLELL